MPGMSENLPKPVSAPGKSLFSQHYLETRLDHHPDRDDDLAASGRHRPPDRSRSSTGCVGGRKKRSPGGN